MYLAAYRDHTDSVTDRGTIATISSSSTELVTVFIFAESQNLRVPQSISDPFILPLDNGQENGCLFMDSLGLICKRHVISAIYMASIACEPSFNAETSADVYGLTESGVQFYQLFVMYKDLSFHGMLYALVESGQSLKGTIRLSNAAEGEVESMRKSIRNGFFVSDSSVSADEESTLSDTVSGDELTTSRRGSSSAVVPEDPWTLNLEWLAKEIDDGEAADTVLAASAEDYMQEMVNDLVYRDSGIHIL